MNHPIVNPVMRAFILQNPHFSDLTFADDSEVKSSFKDHTDLCRPLLKEPVWNKNGRKFVFCYFVLADICKLENECETNAVKSHLMKAGSVVNSPDHSYVIDNCLPKSGGCGPPHIEALYRSAHVWLTPGKKRLITPPPNKTCCSAWYIMSSCLQVVSVCPWSIQKLTGECETNRLMYLQDDHWDRWVQLSSSGVRAPERHLVLKTNKLGHRSVLAVYINAVTDSFFLFR